jgi:hypothetical protein
MGFYRTIYLWLHLECKSPMGTSNHRNKRPELPPPVIGLYDEEMDDSILMLQGSSTTRLYNCPHYAGYINPLVTTFGSNHYNNSYKDI